MKFNNPLTEKATSLSTILTTASYQHMQGNTRFAYGLRCHQILAIIAGSGVVQYKNETHELKRGSAFFLKEDTPICYLNNGGLQSIYITAKGDGLTALCNFYSQNDFIYFENINVNKLQSEITAIISECQNSNKQGKISAMTYSLFSSFFEENLTPHLTPLQKAVNYINANFSQKITLDDIAQQCSISVSKLCHDFKHTYGKTVFTYILDARLNFARNFLLFTPDSKIKEVCTASGFDDDSYFCKAYKSKFGKTPKQDKEKFLP